MDFELCFISKKREILYKLETNCSTSSTEESGQQVRNKCVVIIRFAQRYIRLKATKETFSFGDLHIPTSSRHSVDLDMHEHDLKEDDVFQPVTSYIAGGSVLAYATVIFSI
jgi:hypothetical protein